MSVFSARIKCQKLSMSTQIRQEKSYSTDFGHGWHNGSKAYSAHICGTSCSVYWCRWFALPSVLWCCWLGGRKGIQPVKHLSGEVLAWLSVWGKVQTCIWPSWCHCHSLSLAPAKSRLVATFLVLAHPCSLGQMAVKRVCVCVCAAWHRDMFCAGRVVEDDLKRTMQACGGSILTTVSGLNDDVLGTCEIFEEKQLGGERCVAAFILPVWLLCG